MKKKIILLVMSFISFGIVAQTLGSSSSTYNLSNFAIAVGLSTSTDGLGGNVTAAWKDKFALRLGYEKLDLSFPNALVYTQDDFSFNVSPSFNTGGFSAILDWYFLKSMYLSAGVVITDLHLSAKIISANPLKIGDIEYSPNEMGEMNIAVGPQNKMAPYVGLGFGRNISRDHRFTMSLELGAYHTGSYIVDISGTELFETNGDSANKESINKLNETLKSISWSGIYPVLKLGVSYKIWKK